jgi:glycosyltransferase involved in cell wall biosynthesis
MQIGLCMVVKDEARRIEACLAPILDLFDEIAIVDTGSTDGTLDVLREGLGVDAASVPLDDARCRCLSEPRRHAMRRLTAPWVLVLDADERLPRPALERVRARRDDPAVAGYFGRWENHLDGLPPFEDYKLFLFRNGLRTVGLVHDVAQLDLRARGLRGEWLDELVVGHYPDAARHDSKMMAYRARLQCAIAREPDFVRYHWFLGYMDFLEGRLEDAVPPLLRAARSRARDFPVETLNSAMVLADIHARRGDGEKAQATLYEAIAFHDTVSADFEVAVNWRLRSWLESARDNARAGRLDDVRAYRFAC